MAWALEPERNEKELLLLWDHVGAPRTHMQRISLIFAVILASLGSAMAAEPVGEWLVADGSARIKIDNCGGRLWGVVSWEQQPGGRDANNPDPAKRDRPTLGLPILLDMQSSQPNRWDGQVYNAQNGKTYTAHINLLAADVLRIEGCVLGFLCGGENWSRFRPPEEPPRRRAGPAKPGPTSDVCSIISGSTGSSHERRLK